MKVNQLLVLYGTKKQVLKKINLLLLVEKRIWLKVI